MTRNTGLQGEQPGGPWAGEPHKPLDNHAPPRSAYAGRTVVLVGLMGAGKTSIGC